MKFNVEKLRELLKKEHARIQAEYEDEVVAHSERCLGYRASWVMSNRERIDSLAKRISEIVNMEPAAAAELSILDEYNKAQRSFPSYSLPFHEDYRKPVRPDALSAMGSLVALLDVVTDDEVTINTLERLGFTRDAFRLVVRLMQADMKATAQ